MERRERKNGVDGVVEQDQHGRGNGIANLQNGNKRKKTINCLYPGVRYLYTVDEHISLQFKWRVFAAYFTVTKEEKAIFRRCNLNSAAVLIHYYYRRFYLASWCKGHVPRSNFFK